MNITQLLLGFLLICMGIFSIYEGIQMIVNNKVRDWWPNWWFFYSTDTETGKKFTRKYIRFIDGPLTIFVGGMVFYSGLIILNLLPPGW